MSQHSANFRREAAPASDSGGFWNGARLGQVRLRLEQRRRAVEDALRADREREAADRGEAPADRALESGESAATDWLVEVDSALTDRDARALAEIDAALERLEAGTYGACVDCGTPISPVRLIYAPQASRCLGCQERLESRGPGVRPV